MALHVDAAARSFLIVSVGPLEAPPVAARRRPRVAPQLGAPPVPEPVLPCFSRIPWTAGAGRGGGRAAPLARHVAQPAPLLAGRVAAEDVVVDAERVAARLVDVFQFCVRQI